MATQSSAKSEVRAVPSVETPVLAWKVPRNPAVNDPSAEQIRASGPPAPPPVFRNPMTPFHRAWRSFVAFFIWLLKLDEADAIFRNIPAYFVDGTLKGGNAEIGGLLSWGRFWRLDGWQRRGLGVSALIFIHSEGLVAFRSTGRRSLRIFFTRLREFVVERAMHLLVFLIAAPVILFTERRAGFLMRIITVVFVAAIAVRIPAFIKWLISRNPRVRNWIEALLKRRRERIEARELGEARALLDRAMREPNPLVIPWTALTEARFTLETGFRQVMIYGPPSANWELAWETREGKKESALVSVPVRGMGYPGLGFADLRLGAELRQVRAGSIKNELQQFAAIPGMQDWVQHNT